MSQSEVKTEEKKQHFDDIYVAETPVPFKERIIDALDYISDDFNRQTFDRLILPWAEQQAADGRTLNYVDLACCFGNTTMAAVHNMTVNEIRENWASETVCNTISKPRRLPMHTTGIDISENALAYGQRAGLFDDTHAADLNNPPAETRDAIEKSLEEADILLSTASLVYLDPPAIASLLDAFRRGEGEGYLLVNFLNPFALEKADETKRMLLDRFEFVGSTASRHRRMSELEQENYPGEEWALLEIWVLRRKA